MAQKQTQHARDVVNAFKEKLSRSGIDHVGQKHFDELQLLIESAIDGVGGFLQAGSCRCGGGGIPSLGTGCPGGA